MGVFRTGGKLSPRCTSDAYDGGLNLSGFPDFTTAQTEDNDREVVIGEEKLLVF
jgi:phosphoglucomutase